METGVKSHPCIVCIPDFELHKSYMNMGFPWVAQMVKNLPVMRESQVQSLGWEDPLEAGMATHSSIPAWRIPWTEEPGRLQSMGLRRVRHDWVTNTVCIHYHCRKIKQYRLVTTRPFHSSFSQKNLDFLFEATPDYLAFWICLKSWSDN